MGEYRLTNRMFKVWAEQIECLYYLLFNVFGKTKMYEAFCAGSALIKHGCAKLGATYHIH